MPTVYAETARAAADAADARAKAGISLGPLDGTIVTIKDLFDVKGEPTRAGSRMEVGAGRQRPTRRSCGGCVRPARSSSPRPA